MEKITFNFEEKKWEGIYIEDIKEWEDAYPSINVVDILTKRMPIWLDANPKKAKKKLWKKFITGWLSREQGRKDMYNRGLR